MASGSTSILLRSDGRTRHGLPIAHTAPRPCSADSSVPLFSCRGSLGRIGERTLLFSAFGFELAKSLAHFPPFVNRKPEKNFSARKSRRKTVWAYCIKNKSHLCTRCKNGEFFPGIQLTYRKRYDTIVIHNAVVWHCASGSIVSVPCRRPECKWKNSKK